MAQRPSDLPVWATSPPDPSNVVEPPAAKQAAGWFPGVDIPPGNVVNWFWNRIAAWSQHVAETVSVFTTGPGSTFPLLDVWALVNSAADGAITYGDSVIIDGNPRRVGEQIATITSGALAVAGTKALSVASSGRSVVYVAGSTAGDVTIEGAAVDGTGVVTYTTVAGPGPHATTHPLNDGYQVAATIGTTLFLFDHDTGGLLWSTALAGTPNGIAWDTSRIYVVSAAAGQQLQAFNRATGALLYSYNHNAPLYAVATYQRRLIVYGDTSAHASGARLRSIDGATGFDATGEGGLGVGSARVAWDNSTIADPGGGWASLAMDRTGLFAMTDPGGGTEITRIGIVEGKGGPTRADPAMVNGNAERMISLDREFLICVRNDAPGVNRLMALDRHDLSSVWVSEADETNAIGPDSDGFVVWYTSGGAGAGFHSVARGSRKSLWRIVDVTDLPDSASMPRPIVPLDT